MTIQKCYTFIYLFFIIYREKKFPKVFTINKSNFRLAIIYDFATLYLPLYLFGCRSRGLIGDRGFGEHCENFGDSAVGNPNLAAVQHPVLAVSAQLGAGLEY